MSGHPVNAHSLAAFLEWEARQPRRHESVAGEVHAMTGSSVRHTRKEADAPWQREERTALDDRFAVPSLGTSFSLGELYEGVTLPPMTVREEFDAWVAEEEALREAEDLPATN